MTAQQMRTVTTEVRVEAHPDEMEPAWQTRLGTTWQFRTKDAMEFILAPGYFDSVLGHGMRVNDRIEVVCLATTPATHATLAFDELRSPFESGAPRAIVRLLNEWKIKDATD